MLECYPKGKTPNTACSAYLTAAINTGHTIMFTHPNTEFEMDVLDVVTFAKPKVKNNADAFIKEHGAKWYFCECNPKTIQECKRMIFLSSMLHDGTTVKPLRAMKERGLNQYEN